MATQYPFQAPLLQMGAKIKPAWAKEHLTTAKTPREAFDIFLKSDFKLSSEAVLPEKVAAWHKRVIDGPIILQVETLKNVGEPYDREQMETPLRRAKFILSDGTQSVEAFEYHRLTQFRIDMKPGVKFRLKGAMVRIGMIFLNDQICEVLGGSRPLRDGEEEPQPPQQPNGSVSSSSVDSKPLIQPPAAPLSKPKPIPSSSSASVSLLKPKPPAPSSLPSLPKVTMPPSLKKPSPPQALSSSPPILSKPKPSPPPSLPKIGSKRPHVDEAEAVVEDQHLAQPPSDYFGDEDLDDDPALVAVLEELERKEFEARHKSSNPEQYSPIPSPPTEETKQREDAEEKAAAFSGEAPPSQTWEDVADDTGVIASDDDRPPFVAPIVEEDEMKTAAGGDDEEEEFAPPEMNVEAEMDFPLPPKPAMERQLPGVDIRALLSPLLTSTLVPVDEAVGTSLEHRFTHLSEALEQAETKNIDQIWTRATVSEVGRVRPVEGHWTLRLRIDDGTANLWATVPNHLITQWLAVTVDEYTLLDADTRKKTMDRFSNFIRSMQGMIQLTIMAGSKEATLEAVRRLNQADLQIARKRVQELLK